VPVLPSGELQAAVALAEPNSIPIWTGSATTAKQQGDAGALTVAAVVTVSPPAARFCKSAVLPVILRDQQRHQQLYVDPTARLKASQLRH